MAIISSLSSAKPIFKRAVVDIPEMGAGAQIVLQEFTAEMASEFNESLVFTKPQNTNVSTTAPNGLPGLRGTLRFYALLICCCAVNEDGERISNSSEADLLMKQWDKDLIFRIGEYAADMNGFTKKAKEEAKPDSSENQQPQ